MINPTRFSFGGTAAIVTSMALMAGFDAANAGRATLVSALLIAAVADNLTDSLSVHMYQESERLELPGHSPTGYRTSPRASVAADFAANSLFRTRSATVEEPSGPVPRPRSNDNLLGKDASIPDKLLAPKTEQNRLGWGNPLFWNQA